MYRVLIKYNLSNCAKLLKRTFLSDAYKCNEAWNARFSTPILKNVDVDSLYVELEQRFNQQGKVSAVDIDILANSLKDDSHLEELTELLHKLRLTNETSNTLDSTGHAFIRTHIQNNNIHDLIQILNDRLNYGVFLDCYSANIILDKLVQDGDFKSAANISSLIMLQEDFNNPITSMFALYSCYKFLNKIEPFNKSEIPESEPETPQKKEEIKVRVKFIRNEFFDDHFDLKSSKHLVGKTLIEVGKQLNNSIGNSAQLVGYALYEKFHDGFTLLNQFEQNKVEIFTEVFDIINNICENNEKSAEFLSKLESARSNLRLKNEDYSEAMLTQLKDSIVKQETFDIENQSKIYSSWLEYRAQKLEEELLRLKRVQAITEIQQITKDLEEEERKLWFFENEEKLDLEIESKIVHYPKRWFGKKKKPRVVDEGYIPPEIVKQRN